MRVTPKTALNVWLLFDDYFPRGRDDVQDVHSEVASDLGYYLRDQGVPVTYYFFAEPAMATVTHANLPYIARNAHGNNLNQSGPNRSTGTGTSRLY